jgi:predicted dinucleotide-binding enzyme
VNLGIIGAGSLGTALGERLRRKGHAIMFAGGAAAKEAAARIGAEVGSNSEAAGFGDAVVLAVPFAAIDAALADADPPRGQILWSCVNALKPDLTGLAVGFDDSAAEAVARSAPQARVVGAIPPFASTLAGDSLAYDGDLAPTVFLCGDHSAAKETVQGLVRDLGAHSVDAGPLSAARYVEPAMMVLVSLAHGGGPRDVGLRLLERRKVDESG